MQYSLLVFGIYLIVAGAGFLIAPNSALAILGLPPTTEDWIRIVGLLTGLLGMYFILLRAHPDFARATIYARVIFFLTIAILVATTTLPPLLIGLGVIDLLGAWWTFGTMRKKDGEV
ncbi:hypothetical protein L0Y69_00965 [bacterium]|nr:hypothetical protein [bacterium]